MTFLDVMAGIVVSVATITMLYAVLWCLFDAAFRADDIGLPTRALWILVLLGFNVLGALLYVWFGPGKSRWMGATDTAAT